MKYISVVIAFSGIIKLIIVIREKCVLTFKTCTNFWQEVEYDILFLTSFFDLRTMTEQIFSIENIFEEILWLIFKNF